MTRHQLLNIPGINNILNFGKYKGKTLLYVVDRNPSYIVWCIDNVKGFVIHDQLKYEILKQYNKFKKNQSSYQKDIQILMEKPYCMHATEAMDFLEYEVPEHF